MTLGTDKNFPRLPVVVGIDGSPSSKEALRWAARQAELTSTKLIVISTWHYPTSYGWAMPWPEEVDFKADTAKVLDTTVHEVLGDIAGRDIVLEVIEGHPALMLIDASKRASLVVVGSRGHGEFAGMLIGSVSEFLTAHAECPVVVIRGEEHHGSA